MLPQYVWAFILLVVAVCLMYTLYTRWRRGSYEGYYTGAAQEVEARFLNVDLDKLREKMRELGGECTQPKRKYRRNVYDMSHRNGFARVRDEGSKVVLTVKTYADPKYPEEKEIETTSSFDEASAFMGDILDKKAYHETYREIWSVPGCREVALDIVPGFLPYCEVECDTEDELKAAAEKLGFDWDGAHFGAYGTTFEEYYGVSRKYINDELRELLFSTVGELVGPRVVKNKDKFDEALQYYKDMD